MGATRSHASVGRRKDGRLECYYRGHGAIGDCTAYAVSKDGIHWEKPVLNLVDTPWGKDNNLVPCSEPMPLGQYGNVSDPAKRFAIGMGGRRKLHVYFASETPDVMNDPDWLEKLVDSAGNRPGRLSRLEFWDDIHQEWVGMRQAPNHPPHGAPVATHHPI